MRILLVTLCAAVGCQPIQTQPLAAPGVLFNAPQPVMVGPALVAPPLENTTIVGPQFVAPAPAVGTTAAIGGAAIDGIVCDNPLFLQVTNQEWAWEQIVDVVDDYFRVERENRVQLVGNVMTEGRIDTFPQVGATWLEPHRPDSVGWDNRWESTFQTIRRRAVLRVMPQQGGYLVKVDVFKELEDLPRPENSTAGAATFRNDNSLLSRVNDPVSRTRLSKIWIPLGQDCPVEQQMLAEIRARLTGGQ